MDQIQVIRSKRKTISVSVKQDLSVVVRAPLRMKNADIQAFLTRNREWIEKHRNRLLRQHEAAAARGEDQPFTEEELQDLTLRAKEAIPPLVQVYAEQMGETVGRISIRRQTARWGSCSSRRNLNFNCLLMLCPPHVQTYVIIHELCHLKHLDHSPLFWSTVEAYYPGYREGRTWLQKEGNALLYRLKKQ